MSAARRTISPCVVRTCWPFFAAPACILRWPLLPSASTGATSLQATVFSSPTSRPPVQSSISPRMALTLACMAPARFRPRLRRTPAGGARLVLVNNHDSNPAAFAARYPGVVVAGYFADSLNNGGERLAILDSAGNTVTSVNYDDDNGWPAGADGAGASLEIIDQN